MSESSKALIDSYNADAPVRVHLDEAPLVQARERARDPRLVFRVLIPHNLPVFDAVIVPHELHRARAEGMGRRTRTVGLGPRVRLRLRLRQQGHLRACHRGGVEDVVKCVGRHDGGQGVPERAAEADAADGGGGAEELEEARDCVPGLGLREELEAEELDVADAREEVVQVCGVSVVVCDRADV